MPLLHHTGLNLGCNVKIYQGRVRTASGLRLILFFEKGIRGRLSQVSHSYAKANNYFILNYNTQSEFSYIMYFDANNLYVLTMSRPLPYGGFKWVEKPEQIRIRELVEDSDNGYVFVVVLEYPKDQPRLHNDLPFLPEAIAPPGCTKGFVKLVTHLVTRDQDMSFIT